MSAVYSAVHCFIMIALSYLLVIVEKGVVNQEAPLKQRNLELCASKGLTLVQALRSRVGAKGYWRHFFKNPTTQLHVVWGLTEKKCEQTPKFACFSVQRRPLHMSQAEMLPSHAVLKEGIK